MEQGAQWRGLWDASQQGLVHVLQNLRQSKSFSKNQLALALRVAVWNDHAGAVGLLLSMTGTLFTGWGAANYVVFPRVGPKYTMLHLAALHDSAGAARALLCAHANVDQFDASMRGTPAAVAAELGHVAVLELLILAGADTHRNTARGMSPLFAAAHAGHCAAVQLLVSANADVDSKDWFGNTPVVCAAAEGHMQVVLILLEARASPHEEPCLQRGRGHPARPPLVAAARHGHLGIVRLLLLQKVDVGAHDRFIGDRAIGVAATFRNFDVIRALVSAKANVHGLDRRRANAVQQAIDAD